MTTDGRRDAGLEVTAVIPSLNRPDLLRLAVRSALAQRGVRAEVVVVDDGSSPPVNPHALEEDARVSVIRHSAPRGMGAARNTGLRAARGRWIAFLDDDDAWAPDKLRLQIAAARGEDSAVAYAGAVAIRGSRVAAEIPAPPSGDLAARLLERNVLPAGSSNVVARRSLLVELGGFDETLPHFADWDMWIRLARSAPATAVPELLVGYRYHSGNRSFREEGALRSDFELLAERYAQERRAVGVQLDRVDFARFLAWGPRHRGARVSAARAYLRVARAHRDPGSLVRAVAVLLGERAMSLGAGRSVSGHPLPEWAIPYF